MRMDPGSHYTDECQQSRHDNEQQGSLAGSSNDGSSRSEEEEEEVSYNPMELDTQAEATSASGAGQSAEADWLSYISRFSHT